MSEGRTPSTQPAGYPDGNTRDREGRLLSCELGSRTLTRTEHDGTVTVLAASLEGARLTGPNDVVVKSAPWRPAWCHGTRTRQPR